jgi:type III secretion system low calcium response chaperone LcrH/SycD
MSMSPELTAIVNSVNRLCAELEALPSSRRLSDQEVDIIYSMARNLIQQGRHEEARNYFVFLAFFRPTEARVLVGLGVTNQLLGRYEDAICNYALAAHAEPQQPAHSLSIAECEILQKNFEAAREMLGIVIRYCKEKGGFDKILARADGLISLMPAG